MLALRCSPMRVLFSTNPGTGHFRPLLPLARALSLRAHQVTFAASPPFVPEVEAAGFSCQPVGEPWLIRDFVSYFPVLATVTGEARALVAYRQVFAGPPAAEAARGIVNLHSRQPFDLVVFEASSYGGAVAAEVLGLPHAAVGISSLSVDRRWVAQLGAQLQHLRDEFGLSDDPALEMPFRHLLLSPVPSPMYGRAELPGSFRAIRMESFEPGPHEGLPPWFEGLPPRPLVYLTLGTVQNKKPAVFRTFMTALAQEDLTLVVTTGHDQDPADLGEPPANVWVERFVPQNSLLPRCSAVVSHGGSGTLRAGVWYGLPQVMLPWGGDQHQNAKICRDLGLAVVLDPVALSEQAIRDAVSAVLEKPSYRLAAAAVSEDMRAMPGIELGLRLLEDLVADGA